MAVLREIGAWTIGLTVWGSCIVFMVHGFWTGAWYGYVCGALLVTLFGIMLFVPMYFSFRLSDEELLEMVRDMERKEGSDDPGP